MSKDQENKLLREEITRLKDQLENISHTKDIYLKEMGVLFKEPTTYNKQYKNGKGELVTYEVTLPFYSSLRYVKKDTLRELVSKIRERT